MIHLRREERYAFGDSGRDPRRLYPHVMLCLWSYDPCLDFLWDRRKERWLCVRWCSGKPYPVREVEDEQTGAYRDPDFAFVDELRRDDWQREYRSPDDFCDYLDAELQNAEDGFIEAYRDLDAYTNREFIRNFVLANPKSVNLGGWTMSHLKSVTKDLHASHEANREGLWLASSPTTSTTPDQPPDLSSSPGSASSSPPTPL